MALLEGSLLDGLLRSKGFVWLATRHNLVGVWSQVGNIVSLDYGGEWWAAVPDDEMPADAGLRAQIKGLFDGDYGDRRQELVLIGVDLDAAGITDALDACLLTDAEMAVGWKGWRRFDDPFAALVADD